MISKTQNLLCLEIHRRLKVIYLSTSPYLLTAGLIISLFMEPDGDWTALTLGIFIL